MSCFVDGVVAVATIKLQLTGMQLVTERHRLLGLMTDVNHFRVNRRKQTRRQVTTDRQGTYGHQHRELVYPSWKMKLLHGFAPEPTPRKFAANVKRTPDLKEALKRTQEITRLRRLHTDLFSPISKMGL